MSTGADGAIVQSFAGKTVYLPLLLLILMLWIVLEWWIWGFVALSNIYFALGLAETIVAAICLKKRR